MPADTQTEVLIRSRRRCCLCYGLNRDTTLKSGQIAHLDKNNQNNSPDNLAFLCLDHHDEYDSTSRQRKNITIGEIKSFRTELDVALGAALSIPSHFGTVSVPSADPVAGQYVRIGTGSDSADITLTPLPDGTSAAPRYYVTGFAVHGADREAGPNIGELSFTAELVDGFRIEHRQPRRDGEHVVRLSFLGDGVLQVEEEDWLGVYGLGVNFFGTYKRA